MENLKLEYYFNKINEFPYKEVFKNQTYPWEVINNIDVYIQNKTKNKKINNGKISDFVSIAGNYIIGTNTTIHSNVSIEGPVIIGDNCTIQSGALIRPGTIIGDNCVIGHSAEIKHSIILNGAKAQSFTFVGDSIIGSATRIGSGTIIANRRFDQKNIIVKNSQNKKIDTNTDFLGSIIGDSSRLGANCTTSPGTFIGPYTWILPATSVRGFTPKNKRIFPTTQIKETENPSIELH